MFGTNSCVKQKHKAKLQINWEQEKRKKNGNNVHENRTVEYHHISKSCIVLFTTLPAHNCKYTYRWHDRIYTQRDSIVKLIGCLCECSCFISATHVKWCCCLFVYLCVRVLRNACVRFAKRRGWGAMCVLLDWLVCALRFRLLASLLAEW